MHTQSTTNNQTMSHTHQTNNIMILQIKVNTPHAHNNNTHNNNQYGY